eukprot:scaffold1708_cov322-Pavlova_lutheri.AAC.1
MDRPAHAEGEVDFGWTRRLGRSTGDRLWVERGACSPSTARSGDGSRKGKRTLRLQSIEGTFKDDASHRKEPPIARA